MMSLGTGPLFCDVLTRPNRALPFLRFTGLVQREPSYKYHTSVWKSLAPFLFSLLFLRRGARLFFLLLTIDYSYSGARPCTPVTFQIFHYPTPKVAETGFWLFYLFFFANYVYYNIYFIIYIIYFNNCCLKH